MKSTSVIAIFDIGKTNKKFFLFNEEYKIVLERTEQFPEIKDEDGDNCEDVNALSAWIKQTLTDVLQLKKFDIKAVNFSTYGASFVYINEKGKVIAPLYNYLKPYKQALQNDFYKLHGGEEKISRETASPVLGNLNSGMQLYRIKKEQPTLFAQIKYALHLPQYVSYLITDNVYSDITSIGCHTQLWNFEKNEYHQWVKAEELDEKLAPVMPANEAREIIFNKHSLLAGVGLHDSSAALIPYLAGFSEPFVLISTGTWCISLNPFNNAPLTKEELEKDCLCYMEYQGKPVKASRLFAGYQHEQETKRLASYFNKPLDYYKKVKYNPAIAEELEKDLIANDFKTIELSVFKSYEEAYHSLMANIIRQQQTATQLVITGTNVKRIFVDGGFSNNSIYMHLLSAAFPQLEIFAASVAQATAVGAALSIHKYWNTLPVPGDMIDLKFYSAPVIQI
ncbi:FGGY-family carbohydrate kinase [Chitinophagaceae bacterium LWZ2-11]